MIALIALIAMIALVDLFALFAMIAMIALKIQKIYKSQKLKIYIKKFMMQLQSPMLWICQIGIHVILRTVEQVGW